MNKYILILSISLLLFSCTKDEEPAYVAPPPANEEEEEETEDDSIAYNLPLLYINIDNNDIVESKFDYYQGSISVNGRNTFPNLQSTIEIRGRGNSTWDIHPKKPYQFKFEDNIEFLGMPENDKWLLLAEYSDKSLLRNRTALKMGEISNLAWTPKCEYVEVYMNDEYNGLYLVTEKVEDSKNRLDLGDDGFLCEVDQDWRLNDDDVYFESDKFLIVIKEPEVVTNDEKFKEIENQIYLFETALYGDDFKDREIGYTQYINTSSFVDWYVINEIVKNQDARDFSSIFFQYIPGNKITMGPLWDFDLSFGNVDYSDCEFPEGWWIKDNPWYARLFEDDYFVRLVKNRFNYFNDNRALIIQYIEEQAELLQYAEERNDDLWDLYGRYVWPNPVFFNNHDEEVEHLIDWYNDRMDWLETNIANL